MPGLDNTTIYIHIYICMLICTIYIYIYVHEHTRLAKPGFSSGGRVSCKPNNGALLSTSGNKNDDSKNPNYCALLGTLTHSNSDSKSISAGMETLALLLAVKTVACIAQLIINVTMIATLVLIMIL